MARIQQPPSAVLHSVQILRGMAALAVVLYHARLTLDQPNNGIGTYLLGAGYAGVDVFFVLSGFIITYTTQHDRSIARFAAKRIVRIVPLYFLMSAVYLLITQPLLDGLPRWTAHSISFVPLANENPPFFGYAPLSVGWTLTYEMAFYAIFAAALLAGRWRSTVAACLLVGMVTATQFVLGDLTLSAYWSPLGPNQVVSLMANPLLLEFCFGMAIAEAYVRKPAMPRWVEGAGAISGIAFGCVLIANAGGHGPLEAGIGAALLVAGALLSERWAYRARFMIPFVALGTISYTLYLVHEIVFELIARTALAENPPYLVFALKVGLSLLVAKVLYDRVEHPLLQGLRPATLPTTQWTDASSSAESLASNPAATKPQSSS